MNNYIIYNQNSMIFWQKTKHYGFNFQNQQVIEAVCTEDLDQATLLSEKEAKHILHDLLHKDVVMSGKISSSQKKLVPSQIIKLSELKKENK
jgi:hypothetical protein